MNKKTHLLNTTAIPDAVAYLRVSSKDQQDGFSIPAQRKMYIEYAGKLPVNVIEEFVDIESAKKSGRKNFIRMMDFLIHNRHVKTILVEKTDRLYRNPKDWITLEELGVNIHFIKENTVISPDSRSSDKLMHGIKVVLAKNFIDNLTEEVKKGMHEKASQGMWPSMGPFGYDDVKDEDTREKIIVPNTDNARVVLSLFEWCGGGSTLDEIMILVRKAGFRYGKNKTRIPRSSIHRILRTLTYTGNFYYGGVFYEGRYKPIISQELWDRAQRTLNGHSGGKRKNGPHEFAYKGLLKCAVCGCSVTAEMQKGKYAYYWPTGFPGKCTRDPKACRSVRMTEEELGPHFARALKDITFDAEILDWVRATWEVSQMEQRRPHETAIERLDAESKRLQSRIDAMYVDKLEGRIDPAQFLRLSNQWQEEHVFCLRQVQEHRAALKGQSNEGVRILEFANAALGQFESQSPAEKRRLLEIVLLNSSWTDGEIAVNFRQPFDFLAKKTSNCGPPHVES